jgi:GT2 family glycosyltransferase
MYYLLQYVMYKIGVGIITCNRLDYLRNLLNTLPYDKIDELVVVNDGKPVTDFDLHFGVWVENSENLGVGKSKNKAMKHLYDKGCDYIFIIEDDMLIKDISVFDKYIQAYKVSGIHHFNYGPGSPFNRKQNIAFDLHNRHLLDQHSEPSPKIIIEYPNNIKIALYEHTVAMFSFFTREVLERVGYIDEEFYNAWEHVDHTYRIIKAGYHPPFWWFADIADSHLCLSEAPGAIDNSSIANKTDQWHKNVYGGREIYKNKHGHYPNMPPPVTKEQVIEIIKKLKNENNRD